METAQNYAKMEGTGTVDLILLPQILHLASLVLQCVITVLGTLNFQRENAMIAKMDSTITQ